MRTGPLAATSRPAGPGWQGGRSVTLSARVRRATAVRDDEAATIGLVAAVFATLEAGRTLGEVGVSTMVLARLPDDALPWLQLPLGAVSIVIALVFGAALGRVIRARVFGITLGVFTALLLLEALALPALPGLVPIAWLTVMIAGSLGVTIAWTSAGSTLDARQAKRLFPLCTAAAIAGSFAAGLLSGHLASLLGTTALLVGHAACLAVAVVLIRRLAGRSVGSGWGEPGRSDGPRSVVADLRVGMDEVLRSPLLRLVALAYVLFAVLLFSVAFPFQIAAKRAFADEGELAGALGIVAAIVTAASLVVSLLVANRFYARFGVAAGALLVPLVYLATFAVWIVHFDFGTAAALLIVLQVTQRGVSNAAWSAFYNVVPAARRAQAMAFNDGVALPIGVMLAGVLQLTAARVLQPDQVFWLGLGTAAACTAVAIAIRRRYGAALLATLRSSAGERILEGGPGLGDRLDAPDVRGSLVQALHDPAPAARSMAAGLLARSTHPEARDALAGVLDDPDPLVSGTAIVAILRDGGDAVATLAAERRLAGLPEGSEVERVVALRALHQLGRTPDRSTLEAALADPAATVRAVAVTHLADGVRGTGGAGDTAGATGPGTGGRGAGAATDRLVAALDDPSHLVRRAAAATISASPGIPKGVLGRLEGGSPATQAAALAALASPDGSPCERPVADAVERWALRTLGPAQALQASRADLVSSLRATGDDGRAAELGRFLLAAIDHRLDRAKELALLALAVLGTPSAGGVIRRRLQAPDPEVRAQAIEALDSTAERHVGAALLRLIEPPEGRPGGDRVTALHRLRHDDDPWIAGLARLLDATGDPMPEPSGPLTDIETMLRLRRVPLFAGLAPEDLHRLALVATQRLFEAGATVVREGELGDELFLILEGRVRVIRDGSDGSTRTIRDYGPGDHFGELAVLRRRPRAATVVALDPLETLVIDGDGLTTILRERPDAAMALLATLAERISLQ